MTFLVAERAQFIILLAFTGLQHIMFYQFSLLACLSFQFVENGPVLSRRTARPQRFFFIKNKHNSAGFAPSSLMEACDLSLASRLGLHLMTLLWAYQRSWAAGEAGRIRDEQDQAGCFWHISRTFQSFSNIVKAGSNTKLLNFMSKCTAIDKNMNFCFAVNPAQRHTFWFSLQTLKLIFRLNFYGSAFLIAFCRFFAVGSLSICKCFTNS